MSFLLRVLIFSVFLTSHAWAADLDVREHVEVVGSSEVKVVPDEFVVRAKVVTFAPKLDRAASQNQATVTRAFKAMSALGIARRYVVMDQVDVDPVTQGYRSRGNYRRLGYQVTREVMVVLHDPKRVEPAMRKLFALGVDHLNLQTGSTKMAEALAQAEVEAAVAARKRAKTLSGALGRRLGRAVTMTQSAPQGRSTSNFVYSAATPNLGEALSLGKIKVAANVRVKFLLLP